MAPTKKTQQPKGFAEKIEKIRKKLDDQKRHLLAEAEGTINDSMNPEIENFPDMGDQASAESDRSFILRLRGREQRYIRKIDEAIERIEKGTYGICESCGEPIGVKRLEARPVTTLCIECKTRQEEEEKLRK